MARLNTKTPVANPKRSKSPIKSTTTKTHTHEGGVAYTLDSKSELYFGVSTAFWGENSFYETGATRGNRLVPLMRACAVGDPDWYFRLVRYLRGKGNIRTASIVAAAEGADAQTKAGIFGYSRPLVNVALQRMDEPKEFVHYWRNNLRNSLPGGVQRGVADVIKRLINEYSLLKYDGSKGDYNLGDVIALSRPKADADEKLNALFKYALNKRKHPEVIPEELTQIKTNRATIAALGTDREATLAKLTEDKDARQAAGLTWEQVGGTGKMDAAAWTAQIPQMGYMALLRNLRNFEQAGVTQNVLKTVAKRLADPKEVARSRQLPFRFYSAYREVQGTVWQSALEEALSHSVANIPELTGKTGILIDTSHSMTHLMSDKSSVQINVAAALFGVALAAKTGDSVLYGFADGPKMYQWPVVKGAAVLRTTEQFAATNGRDGMGTNIREAVRRCVQENKDLARIIIFTDGQCSQGDVDLYAPKTLPVYMFNLGGYGNVSMQSGRNRHHLGSLSDSTFNLLTVIENSTTGDWDAIFGDVPDGPEAS